MEGATFAADPMRLMIVTAGKSAAKESIERFRKYIIVYKYLGNYIVLPEKCQGYLFLILWDSLI